ncbi:hypothetical protein [Mesorhizobium sp.]|uniref:hypothetical protein n=1 Tax=Mesorhizobium sp. TaxID=1871066 RepID=UPI00257F6E9A|nr:hypothetical protein [Mesorhizobium sp.]
MSGDRRAKVRRRSDQRGRQERAQAAVVLNWRDGSIRALCNGTGYFHLAFLLCRRHKPGVLQAYSIASIKISHFLHISSQIRANFSIEGEA